MARGEADSRYPLWNKRIVEQKKKNKFDFETEEARQKYLKEIIAFFQDERGEEIGVIAAEKVLDFFLETMGDEIYNKALADAKKIVQSRFGDLELELDNLTNK